MKTTCGIFLFNSDTKQLLLVHPTHAPASTWSIPKGELEEGDNNTWKRALQELKEETNLDFMYLQDFLKYLGTTIYLKNKKKQLVGFLLVVGNNNIAECTLKCNSLVDGKFPEVDRFLWCDVDVASKLMHEAQVRMIPVLKSVLSEEDDVM